MIDWGVIFEESYPVPGASPSVLTELRATIGQPLSRGEIREIRRGQRNPFPKNDPLCSTWQPFDPANWTIPTHPLPASYLSLLAWSNGGEFRRGDRWFQFLRSVEPGHGVRAIMLGHHVPQYMPGALPFALNGGGWFYLFDMRNPPREGEYPVVACSAGNLGWNPDECKGVAETFLAACQGTINVEDL